MVTTPPRVVVYAAVAYILATGIILHTIDRWERRR